MATSIEPPQEPSLGRSMAHRRALVEAEISPVTPDTAPIATPRCATRLAATSRVIVYSYVRVEMKERAGDDCDSGGCLPTQSSTHAGFDGGALAAR